jgi:hypothetical protein
MSEEQDALPEQELSTDSAALPSFAVFDLGDQMSADAMRLRAEQESRWRDLDRQRAELIQSRLKAGMLPDGTHTDWFKPEFFVRYDLASGDIMACGQMSRAAIAEEDKLYEGDGYLIVDRLYDRDADWLNLSTMQVEPRVPCHAYRENRDGHPYWLVNLPMPCEITVEDIVGDKTTVIANTEEVEFEFDGPGTYTVTVLSARCLDGVYVFEVPE